MTAASWRSFGKRWLRVAAGLGAITALCTLGLLGAPRAFGDWVPIVVVWIGMYALSAAALAGWAYAMHPEGRRLMRFAAACVLGWPPAFIGAVLVEERPGRGVLGMIALLLVSGAATVLAFIPLALGYRGVIAVVDRVRRAQGKPSLDESLMKWLRSKRRPQLVAVGFGVASILWLLLSTFLPTGSPDEAGAIGVFLNAYNKLLPSAKDIAIGLIAGALVMWFQEDRFWGHKDRRSGARMRNRNIRRHAKRRSGRSGRRWASSAFFER